MSCQFKIVSYFRVPAILFVALLLVLPKALLANSSDAVELQQAQDDASSQDYSSAMSDYLSAIATDPTDSAAQDASLSLFEQNTPSSIDPSALDKVKGISLPYSITVQETEAGPNAPDFKTIFIVPRDALPIEIDDPVESWPFSREIFVYTSQSGPKANLLCTLHCQSPEYVDLAQRMGGLLALLDDVYSDRMQTERADDGSPFHVWLCSTAPVSNGGEQWRNNIYFYDVGDERSSIEWIREIAHEFSHLAFPAVGGSYTAPEAFANGYLGERLLVRWLARGAGGGNPSIEASWKGTFAGYPNFNRLLIAPDLSAFNSVGLSKAALSMLDAKGMGYMIGMMLDVDDHCGSAQVGTILQGLADEHSTDPTLLYDPVKAALESSAQHKKAPADGQ